MKVGFQIRLLSTMILYKRIAMVDRIYNIQIVINISQQHIHDTMMIEFDSTKKIHFNHHIPGAIEID